MPSYCEGAGQAALQGQVTNTFQCFLSSFRGIVGSSAMRCSVRPPACSQAPSKGKGGLASFSIPSTLV